MNKFIAGSMGALLLLATACGGSGTNAVASASQSKLVDMLVTEVEANGGTIDRACATKIVQKLSADDVAKLVAAGPGGNPDVSAGADKVGAELVSCVKVGGSAPTDSSGSGLPDVTLPDGIEVTSSMVDAMVSAMQSSGMNVDRACVDSALKGMDLSQIAAQGSSPTPEFIQKFSACLTP
ncbi:MAG: hypothetical protein RLZZ623_3226 [Actinomycetota bacterium]|jgi:hypothetical protein